MTEHKLSEQEIKPFPFYGYAPGNYMNTCACCKKEMYRVDKLCFVCLECAIKANYSALTRERERVKGILISIFEQCENSRLGHPADEVIPEIENLVDQHISAYVAIPVKAKEDNYSVECGLSKDEWQIEKHVDKIRELPTLLAIGYLNNLLTNDNPQTTTP